MSVLRIGISLERGLLTGVSRCAYDMVAQIFARYPGFRGATGEALGCVELADERLARKLARKK